METRKQTLQEQGPLEPVDGRSDSGRNRTLALALLAKAGNREALDLLIKNHMDWLRRVVRFKLAGPAQRARRFCDSMDIVQESMSVAAKKIDKLDLKTTKQFRQWLAKIATYEIKDCLKYADAEVRNPDYEVRLRGNESTRSSSSGPMQISSGDPRPYERVASAELKEILDDAVSRLPEDYQDVVLLRDYAGESWGAVRERLHKSTVGAVKQLHQRAWIKIRKMVAPKLRQLSSEQVSRSA